MSSMPKSNSSKRIRTMTPTTDYTNPILPDMMHQTTNERSASPIKTAQASFAAPAEEGIDDSPVDNEPRYDNTTPSASDTGMNIPTEAQLDRLARYAALQEKIAAAKERQAVANAGGNIYGELKATDEARVVRGDVTQDGFKGPVPAMRRHTYGPATATKKADLHDGNFYLVGTSIPALVPRTAQHRESDSEVDEVGRD